MFDLQDALKKLPDNPGVYIMKDSKGEIIYIGKAVSLKNRVRQYFQNSKNHSPKVRAMVSHISEFEYIITDSELEALILECNLIKKNKPRYNILLKDDKHYPYIKVTINEEYPRVMVTRKHVKDGAKYFGPYTDVSAVRETIGIIKKLFKIRDCKKTVAYGKTIDRPCLNYHINRCLAPCQGNVDKEVYMEIIKNIMLFLSGKHEELVSELKTRMIKASEKLDFERAAEIRDEILSIEKISEKQKIISSALDDEDVIAYIKGDDGICIEVFFIRGGKLLGRENFYFDVDDVEEEILSQFIMQFYSDRDFIPRDIILQDEISEISIIESYLSDKKGSKVHIKVPKRGDKAKLIEMAKKNAEAALEQMKYKFLREKEMTEDSIKELQFILGLDDLPFRIEAFDISNIQGTDPVGSMIVFESGKPKNKDYRRFKIKTVKGPNDYASMEEIISRRYKRGIQERKEIDEGILAEGKFAQMPDLIMIDGGEGQVTAAKRVLNELGLNIPVCGMVKDGKHRTRGLIYNGEEISMYKESNAFKLITRIQDEVHRFAITYHRSLRDKGSVASVLDEIKGIGKTRRIALMKHFGSIEEIKKATIDDLKAVDGMNEASAKAVYEFFRDENN
ncbi:excinuclease ABC subunit C [Fervidicella metallireducens AeB]|uniref:UvrABC system protein C n=1 Tax=Fervidicella metallireducens AeB TaxID=1403537 RepID=A0A017RV33_9CLOT|nr:excinuclease ABC subunit UvrC [Fervidicella metallireducens]EYE88608.1 excinuclease ABC subunit C [Fervidicella metallireducens AeB]